MFPTNSNDPYIKSDGSRSTVGDALENSGSGGSTVEITPTLSEGTKIADFEIDGESGSLYAPSGGSSGSVGYVDIEVNISILSQSMSSPILLSVPSALVGKRVITANRLEGDSNIYVCGISRMSDPVTSDDSIYIIAYNTGGATLTLRKVRVWYQ